jgi:tungstate transport system permease protein
MNDFARSVGAALSLIGEADPELLGIVALSLRVSLSASILALLIGAPLGAWFAIVRFRGRQVIIVLTNSLLGLPPVVVGWWVSRSTFCFRGPVPSARRACCSRRPPW